MHIIVCVKQVPDTSEIRIDPVSNTLIRQGVPSIVNPYDEQALETALLLRDAHGGRITVLSMGPPQAAEALKSCLAIGADEAILLSDRAFAGADTLATSYTLSAAIRRLAPFDLILCGKQAIDGDTAQVGPGIAEQLSLPQISGILSINLTGNIATIEREHEDGCQIWSGTLPFLATVTSAQQPPRFPSIKGRLKANRTPIPVWTVADLEVDPAKLGLNGSPTQVDQIFTPKITKNNGQIISGLDNKSAVLQLINQLKNDKIILRGES